MDNEKIMPNVTTHESGLTSRQIIAMLSAQRLTILKTIAITVAITLVITLLLPKTYTASSDVYIDYKTTDPISGRLFSSAQDESYLQTQLDMLKSQAVAEQVIEILGLKQTDAFLQHVERDGEPKTLSKLVANINDNTEVVKRQSSRVIEIRYTADTPETARDFANAIIKAYTSINQKIATSAARNRSEQYHAQLEQLRNEADEIQQKLTRYQQENGILDLNERDDLQIRQLNDLTTALSTVQARQMEAQARKQATDQLLKRGVRVEELPEIAQMPGINDMKSKLSDVNKRLAEIQGVLGAQHPKILALIAERNELQARISSEANGALASMQLDASRLTLQEQSLRKTVEAYSGNQLKQKQHRDTMASYQRQLESIDRIYNAAVQKYDELLMASNITPLNLAILRPAETPTSASKPLLLNNLLASLIIGAFLGLCLGLLNEFRHRKIRTQDDMLRNINLPIIGHVGIYHQEQHQ
jgi:succinoglycan biosynthesis transport protein ExoP